MSARTLLRNRRDRFAGLEIRLKASKLANAQAQRQAIARDRERVARLAERARRALGNRDAAAAGAASPIAASCWGRCPIAACSRAALRWCATSRATPCAPLAASVRARGSIWNFPTDASPRPRMRTARRRASPAKPGCQRAEGGRAEACRQAGRSGQPVQSRIQLTAPANRRRASANRRGLRDRCRDGRVPGSRHPACRRSRAAEDSRGRNRDRRRDRPRSAPARCGRARRRSSGGRPAAN